MKTITGLLEKLNYRVIDGALDGEVSREFDTCFITS